MNIHQLVDHLSINLGAIVMAGGKYFRDGVETAPFDAHLQGVELDVPVLHGEGDYELTAASLVGDLSTAFRVAQWRGDGAPTIVYHHGAGDIPFARTFKRLLPYQKDTIPANLIAVRAPWHRSSREFRHGIRTLENVVAMMAVSVELVERLVTGVRAVTGGPVVVAGVSLGGFVTNRHHAHYNTANLYVPMLAGAAMGTTFIDSIYRRGVGAPGRRHPEAVRAALDFEDEYAAVDQGNVVPVLARYDEIVRFERQKRCYGNRPILELERGHVTGALAFGRLRKHLLKQVANLAANGGEATTALSLSGGQDG